MSKIHYILGKVLTFFKAQRRPASWGLLLLGRESVSVTPGCVTGQPKTIPVRLNGDSEGRSLGEAARKIDGDRLVTERDLCVSSSGQASR